MAASDDVEGGADRAADAGVARLGQPVNRERLVSQDAGTEQVVTLAEEHATLTRRVVETGRVRISTHTEAIEHVERAILGLERVEIEHHPVNAWIDAMPQVREEGEVTIVPVVEERLVVEKRLFVTEEVHIRRVRSTEAVEVPVTLKRQHAVVERLAPADEAGDHPARTDIDLNQ